MRGPAAEPENVARTVNGKATMEEDRARGTWM